MNEESFGIIPLRATPKGWEVFLIQHKGALHWGFPKGKADAGETPLTAASRELFEETGLGIAELLKEQPYQEAYQYSRGGKQIDKKVFYFPAVVTGEVQLQENEVSGGKWVNLTEATAHITFEESKRICKELAFFLQKS